MKNKLSKPRTVKEARKRGWIKDAWGIWIHKSNPDGDGYTHVRDIPGRVR